ncbi:MAG: hypothetical protein ACTS2F_23650 [Thainema sp.]
MKKFTPINLKAACTVSTVVLLALGVNVFKPAVAQVTVDDDGAFRINQNAFDIFSGPLENDSNIPLPDGPVENPQEGHAQPVIDGKLAPNAINIEADTNYIQGELQRQIPECLGQQGICPLRPEDFRLPNQSSLQLRTRFNVCRCLGNHRYGEGIEVNVYAPDGTLRESQRVFIRGDLVESDPAGNLLPSTDSIEVVYGARDRVELRVLNLRPGPNGTVTEHESAIYANINGSLAVEDWQNGGDLDFNDGNYFEIHHGTGQAHLLGQGQFENIDVTVTTEIVETPLDPLERQTVTQVEDIVIERQQFTEVEETRDYGDIEVPTTDTNLLPHAAGLRTANGEQLIYNQYAAAAQVRLGTEGAVLTGQLPPLNNNPAAAPTLLIGTARLNPFADNNNAGLTASVGITQFLHSTHANAIDMYGNRIANPDPDGPRLVQPTGLINDRHIIGYVPATPDQVIPGVSLDSPNGIFEVPTDQGVIITPPDPALVGPGDAAYTDNVGGLIIEWSDGTAEFVPQWTQEGFATVPITLAAGQANRVIYALVPQQTGQNLSLGQSYALQFAPDGDEDQYVIADGGFRVISAVHHSQNFVLETNGVCAVEDTLPGRNAVTAYFNGIQGIYREQVGGEWVATVDLTDPTSADARVGNALSTEEQIISGDPGQTGYYVTNRAGGLYVRGSLTLGLGNQEDVVTTTSSTYEAQVETHTVTTTTNFYLTPRTQLDQYTTTTTDTTITDIQREGDATFDVGMDGLISNVEIVLDPAQIDEQTTTEQEREFDGTDIVQNPEFLANRTVGIDRTIIRWQPTLINRQVETGTDTYPNLSPLLGELALGAVLNFGNTPWTPAANTLRTELFVRGTTIGQCHDQDDIGLRAEVVFHPFGEEQRPAYEYDISGNLVPIFQTEPVRDRNQEAVHELVETVDGELLQVPVNQFIYDDNGDRIPETVGTGKTPGPGIFLSLEELLTDDDGPTVVGGLQLTF